MTRTVLFLAFVLTLAGILEAPQQVLGHGHSHDHDDHHGHSHDHGHGHENPAFKYSRAANEAGLEDEILEEAEFVNAQQKPAHHGHSHDHDHHGHSHGGHGHSHGGHGHSHGPPQREPTPEEREKHRARLHREWDDDDEDASPHDYSRRSKLWFNAICSTLAISVAPFIILFFFTLDNSEEKQGLLKILLSFASGGLLGDAFLHLIPHAIMATEGDEDHGHGHSHGHGQSHHGHSHDGEGHSHDMTVGLGVLSGIVVFLVVEKTVRILKGEGGHGHSHSLPPPPPPAAKKDSKAKAEAKEKSSDKEDDEKEEGEKTKKNKSGKEKKEEAKEEKHAQKEVSVAGYLNLFADFFHNFTDGLAIGASFLAGQSVGWVTTFTIFFHEIPHEIGDYAILIQSGVPPFKAKCLQLLTAVGALLGCVCSLLAEGISSSVTVYILPFTAGGFIYIATVSVIPELLEGKSSFKQSFMEMVGLLVGVGMMVVIAQYE